MAIPGLGVNPVMRFRLYGGPKVVVVWIGEEKCDEKTPSFSLENRGDSGEAGCHGTMHARDTPVLISGYF